MPHCAIAWLCLLCLHASLLSPSPSLPTVGLSVAALAGEEVLGHLAWDAPVAFARAALGRVRVRVRVGVRIGASVRVRLRVTARVRVRVRSSGSARLAGLAG